jgi:Fe2+ or Zn2+ uptake regulation protein
MMNRAPCRQPDAGPAGGDEFRHALGRAGRRCTRQRAAVYACLRGAEGHPTAEQVFAAVRREVPSISLATVYKSLEALVESGLAARLAGGPGPARYDARADAHYHVRCEATGEVFDLPVPYDAALPERLSADLVEALRCQGFEVTGHRLELLARRVG